MFIVIFFIIIYLLSYFNCMFSFPVRVPPKIIKQNEENQIAYNAGFSEIELLCVAEGTGTVE